MLAEKERQAVNLEQLQKLFCDELGDVLHSENMLVKALPKFCQAALSPALRELFENHLAETRTHAARIEKVFVSMGMPAREKKCEGMMGLLVECQHLLTRWKPSPELDRALVCAGRKIEAFEAVAYDSLAAWAKTLGEKGAVDLFAESAAEEEAMSKALLAAQKKW